jgi:hypothetical protein
VLTSAVNSIWGTSRGPVPCNRGETQSWPFIHSWEVSELIIIVLAKLSGSSVHNGAQMYPKWVKTPRVKDPRHPSLNSTVYKPLSLGVTWDCAKKIYLESVSSCLSGFHYGNMNISTYDFNSRASREHVVRSPSESPMRRLKLAGMRLSSNTNSREHN